MKRDERESDGERGSNWGREVSLHLSLIIIPLSP